MQEKKVTAGPKKLYYTILTGCLIAIVGISAVVYNTSVPKNVIENNTVHSETLTTRLTITTKEKNEAANVPATGIPKPTTTTQTTVPDEQKPYAGDFTAPTAGKIIKDYSNGEMVKSETMGDWRVHSGADFGAEEGESVFAVQDCTVFSVDSDEMWGKTVTVICPGELYVKYCGLDDESLKVKKGDRIAKGGIIGKAGMLPIESSAEPHIHVETTLNGETVDPLKAFNLL